MIETPRSTRAAPASDPAAAARWRLDRDFTLPTTLPSWLVLLAAVGACIGWTLHAGPDWSWDRMHYHEYAAWQVLEGALGRGFMPAGGQTFMNPVAYLPAELLVRAGVGELGVSLVLATLHAGCVWAVWLASRRVLARAGPDVDRYAAAAATLAFLTPVFLLEVGASYIDVTATLPLLVGVCCALRTLDARKAGRWAFVAGLAFGLSAGLKLSNALPALAGTVLVLWAAGLRGAPRRFACYVVGGALGTLAGHGWWSAQLWAEFGNPLFPLLGGLFGTATVAPPAPIVEAAAAADPRGPFAALLDPLRIAGSRFTPRDLTDWVTFPLRIADPDVVPNYAYIESRQPDPRLLLLAALGVGTLCVQAWRRLRARAGDVGVRTPSALAALSVFWLVWYVLWTVSASNARYGIGLLMLASPLMVGAVTVLWRAPRARATVLLGLIAVQAAWALLVADPRSSPTPVSWDQDTLRIEVPASLREAPTLHVTRFAMSWSMLAPHVHPESSFASLGSICEDCDRWRDAAAARRVLDAWGERARLIDPALMVVDDRAQMAPEQRAGIDAWLAPYDRRLDTSACEEVRIAPNPTRVRMKVSRADGTWSLKDSDRLLSCPIVADPGAAERVRAMAARVDDVYEVVERQCAKELGPAGSSTRWLGQGIWMRGYVHAGLQVLVNGDRLFATTETGRSIPLGSLTAVRDGTRPIDCTPLASTHRELDRLAKQQRSDANAASFSFDGLVPVVPAAPAAPVAR
jgi:hypothetical protein